MDKILIVGRNGFLAGGLIAALPRERLRLARHDELDDPGLLDGVGCVVNLARDPTIAAPDHAPEGGTDLRLAARLAGREVAYVMASTRKVYAPGGGGDAPLAEDAPLGPTDAYGRNKLAVEERLRAALGERLTVMRIANVFGDERRPPGHRSFMVQALDRLRREGWIVFDMSPFTPRDFLPVTAFGRVAARIALDPPGGVVNVGSGIPLATGRLAHWVLMGYGRGRLVTTSAAERDGFVLDVGRLRALCGGAPPCTYEELRETCLELGRKLAAAAAVEGGPA